MLGLKTSQIGTPKHYHCNSRCVQWPNLLYMMQLYTHRGSECLGMAVSCRRLHTSGGSTKKEHGQCFCPLLCQRRTTTMMLFENQKRPMLDKKFGLVLGTRPSTFEKPYPAHSKNLNSHKQEIPHPLIAYFHTTRIMLCGNQR